MPSGRHTLHLIVTAQNNQLTALAPVLTGQQAENITIDQCSILQNSSGAYTVSLTIQSPENMKPEKIDSLWNNVRDILRNNRCEIELKSARASRPGYFIRYFIGEKTHRPQDYDFEIYCPNPYTSSEGSCPLRKKWCSGAPMGWIHGVLADPNACVEGVGSINTFPDGNLFTHVQIPFQTDNSPFISDRIPIPALTVDEQIYHRLPTMVVATVDKFARPAFEPEASALFGNVTHYHLVYGYYRLFQHSSPDISEHPPPIGRRSNPNFRRLSSLKEPDLALQDELHLIEGPLGSITGLYETAFDHLCSGKQPIK